MGEVLEMTEDARAAGFLKVLVLGDFTSAPCGIRNFADMTYEGLRRHPDLQVDKWDAHYPRMYARREAGLSTFLPADYLRYDVIHLNWHPIALNTYGPGHFHWPKGEGPLVSVYLNDVPPWSGCPVAERAECVVAPEHYSVAPLPEDPGNGEHGPDHLMVYPIPDWVEDLPEPDPEFTVGLSGVRGDGHAEVRGVCEQHGWKVNATPEGPWVQPEEEIRRLARSTVNVCWYHQQRGIAGTPSVMLGSRRPLLLNDSQMFRPWQTGEGYSGELYLPASHTDLERGLLAIHEDWRSGRLRLPGPKVYLDHGWTAAAKGLVNHWLATLEAR